MTKTTLRKKTEIARKWYLIDASEYTLGRLATRVATLLIGKHKVDYTPHIDSGDFVVVVNAPRVKFTGSKTEQKVYTRYSGYPGGIKAVKLKDLLQKAPEQVIRIAVKGMLPKNRLQTPRLRRLKVLKEDKHTYPVSKVIKP